MTSNVSICSSALILLGEDSINSLIDNNDRAKICSNIYPNYIKTLLSLYPWKFTLKKVQLARLTTTPINKWTYAYQLPSDILILRAVYNSDDVGSPVMTEYEILEHTLNTDYTEVYIDYQYKVLESYFPAYFVDFAITALASEIAMSITNDKDLADRKKLEAFGTASDNFQGGKFGVAKRLDSTQNPTPRLQANDIYLSRFI